MDGYWGDIFGKLPCLLEKKLKEEFETTYDMASDEDRAAAEKISKRRHWQHSCCIEQTSTNINGDKQLFKDQRVIDKQKCP